jgi:30S ribosomal protein S31
LASLKEFINFVGQSYNYLKIKIMGKGDKKTKRGKILMGSHGVRRPRRKIVRTVAVKALKEEVPVKIPKEKAPAKPKAEAEEIQAESPRVETPVEIAVKPARKKAPPKASKKEDKIEE